VKPEPDDETAAAIAYVAEDCWPPLPASYGPWLVELARLAKEGTDPAALVPVPGEIVAEGPVPPRATRDGDGVLVISLEHALAALRQEDLLYPDDTEGVEVVTPLVALVLANTATPETVTEEYNQQTVEEMTKELTGGGWVVYPDSPIRVDEAGRLVSGLSRLLAIVAANVPAPVAITYDYDNAARPLTWQPPTREA
jgi:hypothetical protein